MSHPGAERLVTSVRGLKEATRTLSSLPMTICVDPPAQRWGQMSLTKPSIWSGIH